MWNMTGDSALICSVDCLTHTSPHVGASLGLPATPAPHPPPPHETLHTPNPSQYHHHHHHIYYLPPGVLLSPASAVRRRWARGCGAQPPWPALPLKDNAVYCICQANTAILCKSIAHLLPCTLSRHWCASFVWFCLCYLANWLMAEGWKWSWKEL